MLNEEKKSIYSSPRCDVFISYFRIHKDRSFHCDVCNVCLDKRLQGKHKCRPNSGHDECCICLEVIACVIYKGMLFKASRKRARSMRVACGGDGARVDEYKFMSLIHWSLAQLLIWTWKAGMVQRKKQNPKKKTEEEKENKDNEKPDKRTKKLSHTINNTCTTLKVFCHSVEGNKKLPYVHWSFKICL